MAMTTRGTRALAAEPDSARCASSGDAAAGLKGLDLLGRRRYVGFVAACVSARGGWLNARIELLKLLKRRRIIARSSHEAAGSARRAAARRSAVAGGVCSAAGAQGALSKPGVTLRSRFPRTRGPTRVVPVPAAAARAAAAAAERPGRRTGPFAGPACLAAAHVHRGEQMGMEPVDVKSHTHTHTHHQIRPPQQVAPKKKKKKTPPWPAKKKKVKLVPICVCKNSPRGCLRGRSVGSCRRLIQKLLEVRV